MKEITKIIISIAKMLEVDLIAEGIETKEQAEFLFDHKCFLAQGYYYSKPISMNEFLEKLK